MNQQSYTLASAGLKCDTVTVRPKYPIIDPTQSYTSCLGKNGQVYFPYSTAPQDPIAIAAGGASGAVKGAATVGSMTGGF